MKSTVIVFPGSNCDRDISFALEKFQIKNQMVWHNVSNLPKSDLVVLPYKKIYQSGVLMMALSYLRPVLVSDLPPLQNIVIDNETGFLFKSEDTYDLAEKLNFILSDKESLDRVRINGARLVNEKYGWDEIGRLTKNAYQTL